MLLSKLKSRVQWEHKCEKFNTSFFCSKQWDIGIKNHSRKQRRPFCFNNLVIGLDSYNVTLLTEVMKILGANHTDIFYDLTLS